MLLNPHSKVEEKEGMDDNEDKVHVYCKFFAAHKKKTLLQIRDGSEPIDQSSSGVCNSFAILHLCYILMHNFPYRYLGSFYTDTWI